jgi:hypothetical protein
VRSERLKGYESYKVTTLQSWRIELLKLNRRSEDWKTSSALFSQTLSELPNLAKSLLI